MLLDVFTVEEFLGYVYVAATIKVALGERERDIEREREREKTAFRVYVHASNSVSRCSLVNAEKKSSRNRFSTLSGSFVFS